MENDDTRALDAEFPGWKTWVTGIPGEETWHARRPADGLDAPRLAGRSRAELRGKLIVETSKAKAGG